MLSGLLLLLQIAVSSFAQGGDKIDADRLSISIYTQQRPVSLIVRPIVQDVDVLTNGTTLVRIPKGDLLYITISDDKMRLRTIERALGTFAVVEIKGGDSDTPFSIEAVGMGLQPRAYCGYARIVNAQGALQTLLNIDLEKYISGVVESEVGLKQVDEMYKVQSIIARTYALSHLHKHDADGFNLCDDVHCQAFKGISSASSILAACSNTHNLVVVNESNEMITAAFHANCGGETANSEDVWSASKSYLRSVKCPYCSSSKSYSWRLSIPLYKWAVYLAEKGVKASVDNVARQQNQSDRMVSMELGNVRIPYKTVRYDLGLRSAYFGYKVEKDSVVFTGKGYGHGVGLCQDGASEMANRNMLCDQIISFYYTGCKVVNRQQSHSEPEPEYEEQQLVDNTKLKSAVLPAEKALVKPDSTVNEKALFPKKL